MASRLMSAHRLVAYLPNLNAAVRHFTGFAIKKDVGILAPVGLRGVELTTSGAVGTEGCKLPNIQWFDVNRCPLDKSFLGPSFPLPGSVGFAPVEPQVLEAAAESVTTPTAQTVPQPSSADTLECVAQQVPKNIAKDFQDLFPDRDLQASQLTVITLSQRTVNDMTGWNEEVEQEREQLLQNFVEGARDICKTLQEAGFWADFIEPSSGRPYFGAYTNSTLFETDERYRKFGFDINDVGCCKVISHRLWGSHAYIGSIFTDAPLDHASLVAKRDQ